MERRLDLISVGIISVITLPFIFFLLSGNTLAHLWAKMGEVVLIVLFLVRRPVGRLTLLIVFWAIGVRINFNKGVSLRPRFWFFLYVSLCGLLYLNGFSLWEASAAALALVALLYSFLHCGGYKEDKEGIYARPHPVGFLFYGMRWPIQRWWYPSIPIVLLLSVLGVALKYEVSTRIPLLLMLLGAAVHWFSFYLIDWTRRGFRFSFLTGDVVVSCPRGSRIIRAEHFLRLPRRVPLIRLMGYSHVEDAGAGFEAKYVPNSFLKMINVLLGKR